MNIRLSPLILAVALTQPLSFAPCSAQTWELPAHLDDTNTSVTFVVDSTWHTVHGETKGISGTVSIANPKDPLTIKVELSIPVRLFNTNGESRDERLQEVMASATYPKVFFTSSRLSPSCSPASIRSARRRSGTLSGALSIRDSTKKVELPITISLEDDQFVMEGALPIQWSDFNVEDPSILIAKLDPTVTIAYRTIIPKQP